MNKIPLTMSDLHALSEILRAAQSGARVRWTYDQGEIVYSGIARSIGNESGGFIGRGDDVRDACLRITGSTGVEHFIEVPVLVALHKEHCFIID